MTGMLTVPSNRSVGSRTGGRGVPRAVNVSASKVMGAGVVPGVRAISVMAGSLPLFPDDDDAVLRTGHGAADVEQMPLRVDALDPEVRLGVLLVAVVARHLLALDHP